MKKITIKINGKEIEAEIKDKDYNALDKPKSGRWVPEYDQEYWYITDTLETRRSIWVGIEGGYDRLYSNNVFETKEEAEKEAERLKAIGKIRKYIDDTGISAVEGDYSTTILFNLEKHFVEVCAPDYLKTSNVFYYLFGGIDTYENAKQLIEDCKEDLKLVFGIN